MARDLFRAAARFIAIHAGIGFLALVLSAWIYRRTLGDGSLAVAGGWTLTAFYGLVGFAGGAAAGLAAAAISLVTAFERECRALLERPAGPQSDPPFAPLSLHDLSSRTRELADQIVARTVGRIPLPNLIVRLLTSHICQVLVDDFLADCERRGLTVVRFGDVQSWLLAKGLALSTAPLLTQLRTVRWLIIGALAVLGAVAVGLALAST